MTKTRIRSFLTKPFFCTIKAILILDSDGKRVLAKYYDKKLVTKDEEREFEKFLVTKTRRANAELIMTDRTTIVYKGNVDLFFFVLGNVKENELIMMSVLNCLYDSISEILRKNVERRAVMEAIDIVMLILDEICDGGVILDTDPGSVVSRVALRIDDIPIGEQTVAQVFQTAKEQLKWSLLK